MPEPTTPGPILTVTAETQTRQMIEQLRQDLAAARVEIKNNNAVIAAAQADALRGQNAALKASLQQSIADYRATNATIASVIAEQQEKIRRAAATLPKHPLKVEVEGFNTEAFSIVREELSTLLGPLNGVTGRISSVISLFKTLAEGAKHSIGETSSALQGVHVIAQRAEQGVLGLVGAHKQLHEAQKNSTTSAGSAAQGLGLFNNILGPAASKLSLFGTGVKSVAGAEGIAAIPAAAGAAEEGVMGLGAAFSAVATPVVLVGTAIIATVGTLFEAGKSIAEQAEQYEFLGERIGATANQVQGLALVAASSGVPLEEFVQALSRMSFAITGHGGAGQGGGSGLDEASTRVGNSVRSLVGNIKDASGEFLPAIDIFKKVADEFARAPNGITKTSLAMELFGRQGSRLIPTLNLGAAGISQLQAEAAALGIDLTGQADKMEAYNIAIGKLGLAWDEVKKAFADTGVFEKVTSVLGFLAKAISNEAKDFQALGRQFNLGQADATKNLNDALLKGFTEKNLTGLEAFSEASKKKIDEIARYASENTFAGRRSVIAKDFKLDLFPPDVASRIKSDIDEVIEKANKVRDANERTQLLHENLGAIIKREADAGHLTLIDAQALAQAMNDAADHAERMANSLKGTHDLEEFGKKLEEHAKEVEKLNAKYGILGKSVGTAFKDDSAKHLTAQLKAQEAALDAFNKKRLQSLNADPSNVDLRREVVTGLPKQDELLEAAKETAQAAAEKRRKDHEAAVAELKKLAAEHKTLVQETIKSGEAAVQAAAKQLSAADQVAHYNTELQKLNESTSSQIAYLGTLGRGVAGVDAALQHLASSQADAVAAEKAQTDEQSRFDSDRTAIMQRQIQLQSQLASPSGISEEKRKSITLEIAQGEDQLKALEESHANALNGLARATLSATTEFEHYYNALVNLIPEGKTANASEKELAQTLHERKDAFEHLFESQKKQSEEQHKTATETVHSIDAFGKLTAENQKLADELDHLGDKSGTLKERFVDLTKSVYDDAIQVDKLKKLIANTEVIPENKGERDAQQKALSDALHKQISDTKELQTVHDELAKKVFKLTDAYAAFNDVLSGFGVKTPKVLTDLNKMIEGFDKLRKLIETLKSLGGLNVTTGSADSGGGVSGIFKRLIGGTNLAGPSSGGQPILGSGATNAQGTDVGAIPGISFGGGLSGRTGAAGLPTGAAGALGPILGAAGVGSALGGQFGGTLGAVGGGIAGGAVGLGLASQAGLLGSGAIAGALSSTIGGIALTTIIPVVGAVIGAAIAIIGIFHQRALAETKKLADQANASFNSTIAAYNAGQETISQALATAQAKRDNAIQQIAGKTGGWRQLNQLLPAMDAAIAQIRQKQQEVLKTFDTDLGTLRFATGIRDTITSIVDLNAKIKDFIGAGGSAATAAEYFARSINDIRTNATKNLISTEQSVVGLMLQELDLQKQRRDIVASEAQQERDIRNQGVVSRTRSVAQNQAQQIVQLRQQRDLQLRDNAQQISSVKAQIGDQATLFNLTLDRNVLLAKQLELQTQLTNLSSADVAQQEKLLAILQQIKPGGTSADLNKILAQLGAQPVPGLKPPTGTGTGLGPIDSSGFLNLLTEGQFGQKILKAITGLKVPTSLTIAQEQAALAAVRAFPNQTANVRLLAQELQDILNGQLAFIAANSVPGGDSPSLTSYGSIGGALATAPAGSTLAGTTSTGSGSGSGTRFAHSASKTVSAGPQPVGPQPIVGSGGSTTSTGVLNLGNTSVPVTITFNTAPSVQLSLSDLTKFFPNVPSAQSGVQPRVLGFDSITNSAQAMQVKFAAPFLPFVQAASRLLSIGNDTIFAQPPNSLKSTAPGNHLQNVPSSLFNRPNLSHSGPAIGTVNIHVNGTANMSGNQLQKAVTDGLNNAVNEMRARRGYSRA